MAHRMENRESILCPGKSWCLVNYLCSRMFEYRPSNGISGRIIRPWILISPVDESYTSSRLPFIVTGKMPSANNDWTSAGLRFTRHFVPLISSSLLLLRGETTSSRDTSVMYVLLRNSLFLSLNRRKNCLDLILEIPVCLKILEESFFRTS